MKIKIKELSRAKHPSSKQVITAIGILCVQNELLKAMNKSNKSSLTFMEIAEIIGNIKI